MNEQEKQILRTAAERLLAVADGKTLELTNGAAIAIDGGAQIGVIGGQFVRIRPPAAPPEPKPSQVVLDACKRLGVEAWKLDRFASGDTIMSGACFERNGDLRSGPRTQEWLHIWTAEYGQADGDGEPYYWHVRPIAQAKPPELPPKPSQEWLDKHGVELTGECRAANKGEFACCTAEGFDIPQQNLCGYGKWDGPYWIVRKREPAPELPCPPRPTPEQVAAARMPDGRNVKPPTVCEVPNGRAYFDYECEHVNPAGATPVSYDGRGLRRWIAEPAEDVVTPWALDTVPMPLVLRQKGHSSLLVVAMATKDGVMFEGGANPLSYTDLLNEWEQRDGQPCGEVAK